LWRWYINTIITFLDIIHRPVFYSKHTTFRRLAFVSRLQEEPPQLGPIDRASSYLQMKAERKYREEWSFVVRWAMVLKAPYTQGVSNHRIGFWDPPFSRCNLLLLLWHFNYCYCSLPSLLSRLVSTANVIFRVLILFTTNCVSLTYLVKSLNDSPRNVLTLVCSDS
jgi:hypothetical protein